MAPWNGPNKRQMAARNSSAGSMCMLYICRRNLSLQSKETEDKHKLHADVLSFEQNIVSSVSSFLPVFFYLFLLRFCAVD